MRLHWHGPNPRRIRCAVASIQLCELHLVLRGTTKLALVLRDERRRQGAQAGPVLGKWLGAGAEARAARSDLVALRAGCGAAWWRRAGWGRARWLAICELDLTSQAARPQRTAGWQLSRKAEADRKVGGEVASGVKLLLIQGDGVLDGDAARRSLRVQIVLARPSKLVVIHVCLA